MKKQNAPTVCYSIFAIIGIGLICGAVLILINGIRFKQTAVKITATIADITTYYDNDGDAHYEVFVTYSFGGQIYDGIRLGEYSSSMYVGKSISLLCDPEHPGRVKTSSGMFISSITLSIMGIVCLCIGGVPLFFSARKKLQKKRILANGRVLYAVVDRIGINTSQSVNGQYPYIIYCTWKDEYADVLYRFKSDNLWADPRTAFKEGREIAVYVDPTDFSKYYVDAEHPLYEKVVDYTY